MYNIVNVLSVTPLYTLKRFRWEILHFSYHKIIIIINEKEREKEKTLS